MNTANITSKREWLYLKYKKSSIFEDTPYSTERKYNDTESRVTDKITNRKYDNIFTPRFIEMTARERYTQNLLTSDNKSPSIKTHRALSLKKKLSISTGTQTEIINRKKNIKDSRSEYLKTVQNSDIKNKSKNKSVSKLVRRAKSFYSKENKNLDLNSYKKDNIMKNGNDSRSRNLYSITLNAFNVANFSSNVINHNEKKNEQKDILELKSENNIFLESKKTTKNTIIKPIPISNFFNKTHKGFFKYESERKNNDKLLSENDRKKILYKNVKEKKFNKISIEKAEKLINGNLPPMYQIQSLLKKKTNIGNLESVNYDIITTKENTSRENYYNLNSMKAKYEEINNFEIIVPKNYNGFDEYKLKNVLYSEGLHFFNFHEKGDIIGGEKGKFEFKLRNSKLDKNIQEKIRKVNYKFNKMNVKLKKIEKNSSKKKTDLFPVSTRFSNVKIDKVPSNKKK